MVKDDEQGYYTCGRCHSKNYFLKSSGAESPCVVCGYEGFGRAYTVLPSVIKADISQY